LLPELLGRLGSARGEVGAGGRTREQQGDTLLHFCESDLERSFLTWLRQHGLRLPDRAQVSIDGAPARPDFVYDDALTCVYVDGAPHQFPERQRRDAAQDLALNNLGWTVVRVQGPTTWLPTIQQFTWIFGEPNGEDNPSPSGRG
jgi:very-short-patch-repair endonuclease